MKIKKNMRELNNKELLSISGGIEDNPTQTSTPTYSEDNILNFIYNIGPAVFSTISALLIDAHWKMKIKEYKDSYIITEGPNSPKIASPSSSQLTFNADNINSAYDYLIEQFNDTTIAKDFVDRLECSSNGALTLRADLTEEAEKYEVEHINGFLNRIGIQDGKLSNIQFNEIKRLFPHKIAIEEAEHYRQVVKYANFSCILFSFFIINFPELIFSNEETKDDIEKIGTGAIVGTTILGSLVLKSFSPHPFPKSCILLSLLSFAPFFISKHFIPEKLKNEEDSKVSGTFVAPIGLLGLTFIYSAILLSYSNKLSKPNVAFEEKIKTNSSTMGLASDLGFCFANAFWCVFFPYIWNVGKSLLSPAPDTLPTPIVTPPDDNSTPLFYHP